MGQFINAPRLNIVQAVPASADLSTNGLKAPINVGSEIAKGAAAMISDYANKAVAMKRQNIITSAKAEIIGEEHQFALDYLTDPNAFATSEGRMTTTGEYNNIVKSRKKKLETYREQLTPSEYQELEKAYNQATFDTLYAMQSKSNVGQIKEVTDGVMLNLQKSQDAISMAQTDTQKNDIILSGLKSIDKLKGFGIDTRAITYNYINQIQSKVLEETIDSQIINNLDNPNFFIKNEKGEVERDESGNPIIDNGKKIKALRGAHEASFDKKSVKSAIEPLISFGIPAKEAEQQIIAQRKQFWDSRMKLMDAKLERQNSISIDKLNANKVKRDALLFKNTKAMQEKAGSPVSELLNTIEQRDVGNPHVKLIEKDDNGVTVLNHMTDGKYNTYEEVYDNGKYIKNLRSDGISTLESLSQKQNLGSSDGLVALSKGLSSIVFEEGTPETEQGMNISHAQNVIKDEVIGANAIIALSGKDNLVSKSEAVNFILDAKTGKDVDITGGNLNAPFIERADKKLVNKILYNDIINNPSLYRVSENATTVKTLDDISFLYSNNKVFKTKVDIARSKIERLLGRDDKTPVQFNVSKGSYAYNRSEEVTKEKYSDEFGYSGDEIEKKKEADNYLAIMDSIVSNRFSYSQLPQNLQDDPEFNKNLASKYITKFKNTTKGKITLDMLKDVPPELYFDDGLNDFIESREEEDEEANN